jgi:hypothetical protein
MTATFLVTKTSTLDFAGTLYCLEGGLKIKYASVTAIGALVHDTCVFLAISWRLLRWNELNSSLSSDTIGREIGEDSQGDGKRNQAWRSSTSVNANVNVNATMNGLKKTTEKYILGKNLPGFSRALLMDGQMLYL